MQLKATKVRRQHNNTPLISTRWYGILCQCYLHCPYLDSRVRQEDMEEYNPSAIYLHLSLLLEQAFQRECEVPLNFPPSVPMLPSIMPLHLTSSRITCGDGVSFVKAQYLHPQPNSIHAWFGLASTCIAEASEHSIPGKTGSGTLEITPMNNSEDPPLPKLK